MRLVAATRVLNEEDVIEAFVRHTAAFVDHHVILDNGSSDRTPEILAGLGSEGLRLTVLRSVTATPAFLQHNALLYHAALTACAADWVLFLDADEFIDARRVACLRDWFAGAAPQVSNIRVPLINYEGGPESLRGELNVTRRLTRRAPVPHNVWKVFVRAMAPGRVSVDAGNHQIFLDGDYAPGHEVTDVRLAHYPSRSPLHWAVKAFLGWSRVLAAGEPALLLGRSTHYRATYERLIASPEHVLRDALAHDGNAVPERADLVHDPLDYRGGELRYTVVSDPRWRALQLLLEHTGRMCAAHGALLDAHPQARAQVEAEAYRVEVLLQSGLRPATAADAADGSGA
jgi:hypothetical protein